MKESSSSGESSLLQSNQLGTGGIVFMVIAAASPMGAVFVGAAASIGNGSGVGTPGVYGLASVVLCLFAVGFVAMSRHVTNAGAFYAYVTLGLGRPMGFGTALVALLSYNVYVVAILVYLGVFASNAVESACHLKLPWEAWSLLGFLLLAALSYFKIELSAVVLGVLLVCEVLVLSVLDVAVLVAKGPHAFPLSSFGPGSVFTGATGVSVIYAFSSFTGFEATAIYGEEARNPRRSVPRATYIAVGVIAAFYVVTIWALIAAYGAQNVVAAARSNPEGFVFAANARFVGFTDNPMNLLICTSMFASLLAFHNATARYMYALARDGVLPKLLSRTHPRYGSPFAASVFQLAITAGVVIMAVVVHVDATGGLAPAFLGLGALGILLMQTLASFAVVGFFRGSARRDRWRTQIAPVLGGVGLSIASLLAIVHFDFLTGAHSRVFNSLWCLLPITFVVGLSLARYFASHRPREYAGFGGHSLPEARPCGF